MVGGRIGREQVQMLAANEVALMVLGCIAAELIAALGAERAVERKVNELLPFGRLPMDVLPLGMLPTLPMGAGPLGSS